MASIGLVTDQIKKDPARLLKEQRGRRRGIEAALAPRVVPDLAADRLDGRGRQCCCDVLLDACEGRRDTASHPWPPVGWRS